MSVYTNHLTPYAFYKIPKELFSDEAYAGLSSDAKLLFGLLLDRASLSAQNGWVDKEGRVYQFFTVQSAMTLLHFGHEKVCKLFKELTRVGLITRRKQGLGKPALIYLNRFFYIGS